MRRLKSRGVVVIGLAAGSKCHRAGQVTGCRPHVTDGSVLCLVGCILTLLSQFEFLLILFRKLINDFCIWKREGEAGK